MEKSVSLGIGVVLAGLATAGFIKKKKHLLGLMNVDVNHSVLRVPTTVLLLFGSRSSLRTTRSILNGASALYFAIGTAGLFDRKIKGFLPSGLTRFDIAYHFLTGALALWLGSRPGRMIKP